MVLCAKCLKGTGWPRSMLLPYTSMLLPYTDVLCEKCGSDAVCYDVPSGVEPPFTREEIVMEQEREKDDNVYLKFATDYAEVRAAVRVEPGAKTITVGFACCNPKDMSLERTIKVPRGITISKGRLAKSRTTHTIELPVVFRDIPKTPTTVDESKAQTEMIREAVVEYMAEYEKHNMGFAVYTGDPEKWEFRSWFPAFVEMVKAGVRNFKQLAKVKEAA